MKKYRATPLIWGLLLLLSAFAIYPALIYPVEEHSYDAAVFHVYRGVLFSAARAEGILYPRWVQPINGGLGGPLFDLYSPLAYFALDSLHAVYVPQPLGWRVLVALALLSASVGTFLLASALVRSKAAALASAVVFLYSFPLLREVYERGSPEGFVVALYPSVLWASVRLLQQPNAARVALGSALWAAAMLTHLLSALFLIPLWFVLMAALALGETANRRRLAWPLASFFLGLGLSAFFLLPFVVESGSVQLDNALRVDYVRVAQNALSFVDLIRLPLPYDTALDNNIIGERIGLLPLFLLLAALASAVWQGYRRERRDAPMLALLAMSGLGIIWLQTESADFVWRNLSILAYVQIRSRLLGLAALCAALGLGYLVAKLRGRPRLWVAAGLGAAAILPALPVIYPQLQYRYLAFSAQPTVAEAASFSIAHGVPGLTAFDEFLPVWRTLPLSAEEAGQTEQAPIANLPSGARVVRRSGGNERLAVEVDSPTRFDAAMRVLYFPGWAAYVDGVRRQPAPIDGSGYVLVRDIPAGEHVIALAYEGTRVQVIGDWLSVVTGLVLTALIIAQVIKRRRDTGTSSQAILEPVAAAWRVVLLPVLALLLILKALWIDPQTNWLRTTTDCWTPIARYASSIDLCQIEIGDVSQLARGGALPVTLYWMSERPLDQEADTFVQLLGPAPNPLINSPLWGQENKQAPGYHAVMTWASGKIYRDEYELHLEPNAPRGAYKLEIGWYYPAESRRLTPEIVRPLDGIVLSDVNSLWFSGIVLPTR